MAEIPTSPTAAVLLSIIAAAPPLLKVAETKFGDFGRQSRRLKKIEGARKEIGFWNARADLLGKVLAGDDLAAAKVETAAEFRQSKPDSNMEDLISAPAFPAASSRSDASRSRGGWIRFITGRPSIQTFR